MTARAHSMLTACLVLGLSLAATDSATAYTIGSGFTEGCHERLTLAGYLQARAPLPDFEVVPVPDGTWEEVADYLLADAEIVPSSRQEKFLMFSLLAGVRAPDNEGFSLSSLSAVRTIQANPAGQYDHCLRAAGDDYLAGNEATLAGCRESVEKQLRLAGDSLEKPIDDQVEDINFTLDFYGTFTVEVWTVAYRVGRALHPFEDSFTHTLRTDDLRKVIHFMNYAEAIDGTLEEGRDGLAHSSAADVCYLTAEDAEHPGNKERVFATIEGTADLFRAASRMLADDPRGPAEVQLALDKWLTYVPGSELGYEEGCIEDNDYCDSRWLANARLSPSGPILCAVTAPGSGPRTAGSAAASGLWLAAAALLLARRRR